MLFFYPKKKTCVASYFLYLTKTSWNNLAMCLCMRMINQSAAAASSKNMTSNLHLFFRPDSTNFPLLASRESDLMSTGYQRLRQKFISYLEKYSKGQIKSKSRLARGRFSQKRTDQFYLSAVKSKNAKNTNSSIRFLGEVSRP